MSGQILFSARKTVDRANDRVIYFIPRVGARDPWRAEIREFFKYEEPLIEGVNDDPKSLDTLRQQWFSQTVDN